MLYIAETLVCNNAVLSRRECDPYDPPQNVRSHRKSQGLFA